MISTNISRSTQIGKLTPRPRIDSGRLQFLPRNAIIGSIRPGCSTRCLPLMPNKSFTFVFWRPACTRNGNTMFPYGPLRTICLYGTRQRPGSTYPPLPPLSGLFPIEGPLAFRHQPHALLHQDAYRAGRMVEPVETAYDLATACIPGGITLANPPPAPWGLGSFSRWALWRRS
jgi:hypothetical protein